MTGVIAQKAIGRQTIQMVDGMYIHAAMADLHNALAALPHPRQRCILMPYANPADRKAYEALRAETRRAQGLCAHCSKPARKGMAQCADCAKRYAKPGKGQIL